MNRTSDKLLVALDVSTADKALELANALAGVVGGFKIGLELFTAVGPSLIVDIRKLGGKVFLDLKLHDIPNTVAGASRCITRLGVDMFNVHADGGVAMMRASMEAAKDEAEKNGIRRPKVIAVTVLTSLDRTDMERSLGASLDPSDVVKRRASMAMGAGLDGVVASAKEVPIIRQECGQDFLIVTPGIRPAWSDSDDQKRITTPHDAIELGASYLVVGRPICHARSPVEAACRIVKEMTG